MNERLPGKEAGWTPLPGLQLCLPVGDEVLFSKPECRRKVGLKTVTVNLIWVTLSLEI